MLTHITRTLALAALLFVAAGAPAHAQASSSQPPDHHGLSLLLTAGGYEAFGGGLGFGSRDMGIRGTGGWAPVIIGLDNGSGGTDIKFYNGFQAGGDGYLRIWSPQPTSDIGAQVGYRYNSQLGHGLAAGGYFQLALNRSLDLNVSFGLLVFPDGEDKLKQEQNLPPSTTFSFPGPKVNVALSAALVFWP